VFVDEFSQGDTHFFFNSNGVVNVTADTEELGACVLGPAERLKLFSTHGA